MLPGVSSEGLSADLGIDAGPFGCCTFEAQPALH
jgi:hypothetical protein